MVRVLQVESDAARREQPLDQLARRQAVARFQIRGDGVLKELGYGSTLISIETSDIHALMPVLKSWLPDIDVISPSWVKQALVRDVETYLATCS